jgi:hypothetical protein
MLALGAPERARTLRTALSIADYASAGSVACA